MNEIKHLEKSFNNIYKNNKDKPNIEENKEYQRIEMKKRRRTKIKSKTIPHKKLSNILKIHSNPKKRKTLKMSSKKVRKKKNKSIFIFRLFL